MSSVDKLAHLALDEGREDVHLRRGADAIQMKRGSEETVEGGNGLRFSNGLDGLA